MLDGPAFGPLGVRCLRHCGRLTPVLDPWGGRPHPWLVWVASPAACHLNGLATALTLCAHRYRSQHRRSDSLAWFLTVGLKVLVAGLILSVLAWVVWIQQELTKA